MARSGGGASGRLALGAVLVAGTWVVAFWMAPGPDPREVDVEFGPPPERPSEIARPPVREPDPVVFQNPHPVQEPVGPTPETPPEDPNAGLAVVPPKFYEYRAVQGDTFGTIAAKFLGESTKWTVIAQANPLLDPNRLRAGTIVRVPVDPKNIQGVENPQGYELYTIQANDTLSEIAKKVYGKTSLWGVIAAANPDVDPKRLKVGATLKIPPAPPPSPPGQ
jgi:nucleoid-associated protein YgaU